MYFVGVRSGGSALTLLSAACATTGAPAIGGSASDAAAETVTSHPAAAARWADDSATAASSVTSFEGSTSGDVFAPGTSTLEVNTAVSDSDVAGEVSSRGSDEGSSSDVTTSGPGRTDVEGAAPRLIAEIDETTVEFASDVFTYNGRPPMMDISAQSEGETSPWRTLRVAVAPTPLRAIEPGEYGCGPGASSFIMLLGDGVVFDSTKTDAPCKITVVSPGTLSGQVFSGSFDATLYTSDGARAVALRHGRFFGVVP